MVGHRVATRLGWWLLWGGGCCIAAVYLRVAAALEWWWISWWEILNCARLVLVVTEVVGWNLLWWNTAVVTQWWNRELRLH